MLTLGWRSSALSDFQTCEHKFYLNYVLGIRLSANKKAFVGTIFHKVMEYIGKQQLVKSGKLKSVYDEDTKIYISQDKTPIQIFKRVWAYYKENPEGHDLGYLDYKKVETSLNNVLSRDSYNPLKNEVFEVERFFDFVIDEPWAKYSWKVGDKEFSGNLRIRGTMDLLLKFDDTLVYVDWKTGAKKCWKTNQEKTIELMDKDSQLSLYFYALRKLYPEFKYHVLTLYYTEHGPHPIPFDDEHYQYAENMLRSEFEKLKSIKVPKLIIDDPKKNFHCNFCQYNTNLYKDSGKTYCKFFQDEIIQLGMDKVTENYYDREALYRYEGGGSKKELQ